MNSRHSAYQNNRVAFEKTYRFPRNTEGLCERCGADSAHPYTLCENCWDKYLIAVKTSVRIKSIVFLDEEE